MGKTSSVKKIKIKEHYARVKTFVKKLSLLDHTKRLKYLKKISSTELKILSEIIFNFLKQNIKISEKRFGLYNQLKKLRPYLYQLIDKKNSEKLKRGILSSVKGLAIINFLFPILEDSL